MTDAWQSYLEMAMGLTKTSKKKAEKVVKELVGKGEARAGELQSMAEDLIAAGMANREALTDLVQAELDKALARVGLVKAEEVTELRRRIAELEGKLAERGGAEEPAKEARPAAKKAPAKKAVAKAAPAKKSVAKAAPAKKAVAKKSAGAA